MLMTVSSNRVTRCCEWKSIKKWKWISGASEAIRRDGDDLTTGHFFIPKIKKNVSQICHPLARFLSFLVENRAERNIWKFHELVPWKFRRFVEVNFQRLTRKRFISFVIGALHSKTIYNLINAPTRFRLMNRFCFKSFQRILSECFAGKKYLGTLWIDLHNNHVCTRCCTVINFIKWSTKSWAKWRKDIKNNLFP